MRVQVTYSVLALYCIHGSGHALRARRNGTFGIPGFALSRERQTESCAIHAYFRRTAINGIICCQDSSTGLTVWRQ